MSVLLSRLLADDVALPQGVADAAISGLTADSRQVKPGFLFAALPGTKVDGAQFIPQAVAAGAAAVVIGDQTTAPPANSILIKSGNPHQLFARIAARFAGSQPDIVVAVTGTNGKTSVAAFVREIWQSMGFRAASIGTIGIVGPQGEEYLAHTTPDPVKLHHALAELAQDHVTHLAMEASSHGLAQFRLDGVRLAAGGFTNLTRDHLDYHATIEDYFDAKMRLFSELLPQGAPAVVNADVDIARDVVTRAKAHGLTLFTVGEKGHDLKLVSCVRDGFGQRLVLATASGQHEIYLPLVGDFQVSNALVAAGLVIATGGEEALVLHALESLKGAKGRLDLVAHSTKGAPIFVDFAHTPDALEKAILALRPYVKRKLAVVFGAGGDRDKGKRPQMGAIAAKHADIPYVTDDNPRSEDPAVIRAAVMAACPGGIDIGDRALAIRTAVEALEEGDILLVAGKGHEPGQTVGGKVLPFSDHDAVKAAVAGQDYHG
ncbi:UDP-N-acetylmuramoyl-L-alanyl-D-glutamate--2,6-diaminopimelate ligase [Taklimakanibacter albus]|uniref:UDP-N-acetylmuramoyl-L-alanyl-D-glutamate--2, 6-diaminopimelate ligase n=1 Tax=Taklimakanibacter albus TaxID=2800327 RepID=A0ACC5QYJ0_9HYPH|nr:UDP-N-acetylmuramoyl-L-alanyl-D-glutamate--2,6-diaminopimelate ligase [Aestuariivirga sp. YIM B02566]MBK1865464.1 UDP-N-acetylmuramoyl-L-alanyl-D-glutamate--2,6-diaminopimelate ligase [Aestuariivirga sp. YIM B02566]